MNIKILDSWLRDYLKTKASPKEIAEKLSLSSVSVERLEKHKDDYVYDIEVTTNRVDLMSLIGLAREASAVLPQYDIPAEFVPPQLPEAQTPEQHDTSLTIHNDPELVNRICAVVLEVTIKDSPSWLKERLESTDIRSLNNVIDITNYIMRVIGHPTHAFDYDRLQSKKITIRESKKGEVITTLDKKSYILPGGDIVAEDGKGTIIDLPGIMGLENSAITNDTKRIVFFINNDNPFRIRKTSMFTTIRTEAAVLNEKGIDPNLAGDALLFGIELFKKLAHAKVISKIIDIYPNKSRENHVRVSIDKISRVIGIDLPVDRSIQILSDLGFEVQLEDENLAVTVPAFRSLDVETPEDVIEEIARVYGYHNLPSILPEIYTQKPKIAENDEFYWETRVKNALKYWGFTEVYTSSIVSEEMYEGPLEEAVTLENPLTEDMKYMRCTLVLSLLQVIAENKTRDNVKIFEIANTYFKNDNKLPVEKRKLAGVIKKPRLSFFEAKGLIEQMAADLGIKNLMFKSTGGTGAEILIDKESLGEIEILDDNLIDFELDFELLIKHATLKKVYSPISKYPPVIEDLAIIAPDTVQTGDIINAIKRADTVIQDVSLLDRYENTRTFHIIYQDKTKNLTNEEVADIRTKILKTLKDKFNAKLKA